MPAWALPFFKESEISASCKGSEFVTSDCVAKPIKQHILMADEYAQEGRLSKRLEDPDLLKYRKLVEELDEEQDAGKKFSKKLDIRAAFPDRKVLIADPDTREIHTYQVPNPYRALSYREDEVTTFGDPNGGTSKHDAGGIMRVQNFELAKHLIPKSIIADKAMTVAILESLWYCGQNPSISSDPRCFPARLLEELREYMKYKGMKRPGSAADPKIRSPLDNHGWPAVQLMVRSMLNAIGGAETYTFERDLFPFGSEEATAPATAPPATAPATAANALSKPLAASPAAGSPAAGAAAGAPLRAAGTTDPAGGAGAPLRAGTTDPAGAPRPPLRTGVTIIPTQLGGYGITPVLPGRALGALPAFTRA